MDKARARTKGGNGLGLSIAKQLVENYKGRILAESVVGKGLSLEFLFLSQNRRQVKHVLCLFFILSIKKEEAK